MKPMKRNRYRLYQRSPATKPKFVKNHIGAGKATDLKKTTIGKAFPR